MTYVNDGTLSRLKSTNTEAIVKLQGIDAFEIDGKLWYRLLDVTRALYISESISNEISAKLQHSPHAHHWRENYYGFKNHPSTLIDADVIEDIAIRYAFVPHADVMTALPQKGEKVDLPADRYSGRNWNNYIARLKKIEERKKEKAKPV